MTINDGLLAQAKEVAARSHRTLSSVVEDALERPGASGGNQRSGPCRDPGGRKRSG